MSDTIITKDQIRDLIKKENIRVEDLYSEEQLKELKNKYKAEGYSEAIFKQGMKELSEEARQQPKEKKPADYLDPAQNPFIKTD